MSDKLPLCPFKIHENAVLVFGEVKVSNVAEIAVEKEPLGGIWMER